jgi:hypothetical protein
MPMLELVIPKEASIADYLKIGIAAIGLEANGPSLLPQRLTRTFARAFVTTVTNKQHTYFESLIVRITVVSNSETGVEAF